MPAENEAKNEQKRLEVTVVIPVFNGANYLGEAIDSVLAQTYRDFEILVVDDGSTDETWAIVEQYRAAHPHVVRGLRKPNGGVASALNAGIRAATGKYFAWLSHDDRFIPNKLERQFESLQNYPAAVGVYSDYSLIDTTGNCIGRAFAGWYPQGDMLRHLLQTIFINGSTLVVERRCLLEVGLFDETLRYAQDAMMWVHLIMRYPLAHVPEPLTEYRIHPEQTTTSTKKRALRRDNHTWLRKTVDAYTIVEIFPELNKPDVTAAELAAAYIYLGEVLAVRHLQFRLGIRQFWRAWYTWPNLRNPVLANAVRALLRVCSMYLAARRFKARYGRYAPNQHTGQIIVDLRSWSEVVKVQNLVSEN